MKKRQIKKSKSKQGIGQFKIDLDNLSEEQLELLEQIKKDSQEQIDVLIKGL